MGSFDLKGYAALKGFEILGQPEPGKYQIRTKEGTETTFDAKSFLESKGMKDPIIIANDENNPFQDSHVSLGDRARLAFGNDRGNIDYLKKKYEDVKLTDGGLVVKDRGSWHAVDKAWSSDGWSFAEAAKDLVDVVPDAISVGSQILGAAGGAAAGASVGALPGLAAGSVAGSGAGAVGAGVVNHAIGKILGTYNATPEEEMHDLGWEAVAGLGGELIPLGGKKVVVPLLKKSLSFIGKAAQSDTARQASAKLVAGLVGGTEHNAGRLIQDPDAVISISERLQKAAKAVKPTDPDATQILSTGKYVLDSDIDAAGKKSVIEQVRPLLENAGKWVSAKFDSMEKAVIEMGEGSQAVDLKPHTEAFLSNLANSGLVKTTMGSGGKVSYSALSAKEMGELLGVAPIQAASIARQADNFVKGAQNIAGAKLKGKAGVEQVINLRRSIDNLYYDSVEALGADGKAKLAPLFKASNNFKASITDGLSDNVKNGLMEMNDFYAKHLPIANNFRTLSNNSTALEAGVNKLYSDPSKYVEYKSALDAIAALHPTAQNVTNNIYNTVAAGEFARVMPKGKSTLKTAVGHVFGPRKVASSVQTMVHANQWLRSLPVDKRMELLSNSGYLDLFVKSAIAPLQQEDATTEQLVKQAASGQ